MYAHICIHVDTCTYIHVYIYYMYIYVLYIYTICIDMYYVYIHYLEALFLIKGTDGSNHPRLGEREASLCDMTSSCLCHDLFISMPWLLHICAMTPSYLCHDLFICGARLVHIYDTTHSHVWGDFFISMTTRCYASHHLSLESMSHDMSLVSNRRSSCHMNEEFVTYESMSHDMSLVSNRRSSCHMNEEFVTYESMSHDMSLVSMCHTTRSCVKTSCSCVHVLKRVAHLCDVTRSCLWRVSLIWVPSLDVTRSYLWLDVTASYL